MFVLIWLLSLQAELRLRFGELALLFPYTDLQLILFGEHVVKTFETSKGRCIARLPFAYVYKAPESAGGGKIQITLETKCPDYVPKANDAFPDAILCLSGDRIYSWPPLAYEAAQFNIPFAVTSFSELLLDHTDVVLKSQVLERLKQVGDTTDEAAFLRIFKAGLATSDRRIFNNFMNPGQQRCAIHAIPTADNAWIYIVHAKEATP